MRYPDCETQGLVILRPYDATKPLMVSGGGRSGTTALARACGTRLTHSWTDDSLNAEEDEIRDAWLSGDISAVRRIREERGIQWVGKFPLAIHFARVNPALMDAADCNWICSLRDPVSEVYYDRKTDPERHVVLQLEDRLRQSIAIVNGCQAAAATGVGVAMVSYEAMLNREKAINIMDRVIEWIAGCALSWEPTRDAVAEIVPRDPRYRANPLEPTRQPS